MSDIKTLTDQSDVLQHALVDFLDAHAAAHPETKSLVAAVVLLTVGLRIYSGVMKDDPKAFTESLDIMSKKIFSEMNGAKDDEV